MTAQTDPITERLDEITGKHRRVDYDTGTHFEHRCYSGCAGGFPCDTIALIAALRGVLGECGVASMACGIFPESPQCQAGKEVADRVTRTIASALDVTL